MTDPTTSSIDASARLAAFLDWLTGTLQTTEAFVKEQAPDVVQQYLTYTLYLNWTAVALSILIPSLVIILGLIARILLLRTASTIPERERGRYTNHSELITASTAVPLITTTVGLIAMTIAVLSTLPSAIKITLAPKVVALEWITSQVRSLK